MNRIGYRAAKEFGYLTKKDVYAAMNKQLNQEWRRNGKADPFGKICVDMKLLNTKQLNRILESSVMEPNINWDKDTNFARMLQIEKAAKQTLGDYIGASIAKQPSGISIFLSNSSTIYYVFLGMVKHKANVEVITIHAAVLAAYPSVESKIRNVRTTWKGRVDLDNALIEPADLGDPAIKAELGFLEGGITHAVISATGFDSTYGPMATNATAREVARRVLQSRTHTCVVIDHTKLRINTTKNESTLLFHGKEWNDIRQRGDLELFVTCHPKMPKEQAALPPNLRSSSEIEKILSAENVSKSIITQVVQYNDWSSRLGDILKEVSFTEGKSV